MKTPIRDSTTSFNLNNNTNNNSTLNKRNVTNNSLNNNLTTNGSNNLTAASNTGGSFEKTYIKVFHGGWLNSFFHF